MTEEVTQGEVVEDARTGEIIPKGSPPELRPGILAQININQVGTLDVSPEELASIQEPLDPKDVQIRPDGLVYLPWTWYNKRLNKAFGILKWGLIPQGSPQIKEMGNSTLIVWLHWLVVKGVPISMAGGETSYQPSNYTMSYGDAMEGARSNSLARNCKNLGMAIELWDQQWVSEWKKEYAETYPNPNPNAKQKNLWRKKGSKSPEKSETRATSPSPATPAPQNSTQQEKPTETTSYPQKNEPSQPEVKTYTGNQILANITLVQDIINESKKPSPVVCGFLGKLEKGKKFSVEQILNMLKEA